MTAAERIADPSVVFVSIADAADFLGIAKSTAYAAVHKGQLCEGVPVVKVGRRYLVAAVYLRRLAGTNHNNNNEGKQQ